MKKLKNLRQSDIEEYEFPGTDAAVLVVKKKTGQKVLEECYA